MDEFNNRKGKRCKNMRIQLKQGKSGENRVHIGQIWSFSLKKSKNSSHEWNITNRTRQGLWICEEKKH